MSVISSLTDWIRAVVEKIVDTIVEFVKEYWVVLLAIAIIAYAPAIGAYLSANGFPALGAAFSWVGTTITPVLSTVWEGVAAFATPAWEAFAAAGLGTKLALVAGAMALITPEEASEVLTEAVDFVAELAADVIGGVISATGILPWIIGGVGLWWYLGSDKEERSEA